MNIKEKRIKYYPFTNKVIYKNYKNEDTTLENFNITPHKIYVKVSVDKFIKLDTTGLLHKYRYSENLYSINDYMEWYDKKILDIKKQADIVYTKCYIKLLEANKLYSNIKYFSFKSYYNESVFKFSTRDDKYIISRYSSIETNIFDYEKELTIPNIYDFIKIID